MKINRRTFLKSATLAVSTSAFPFLRASAASPLKKINMAFVGIGCRGYDNFSVFAYYKDLVNVVAFCDTEMGSTHTQRVLKAYPDVPRYQDFRKMFDVHEREIDAVCISTPDFSHFPAAMLAMSLGKAVYCEKPMSNCFREISLMTAAAKKHKVVTQMGNQGHSGANYWQCKALVENGFLKDVAKINAFMCANNRRWFKWNGSMTSMPGEESEPAELDWDTWLSQRPYRPFNHNFIHGNWRCFYEYGTGVLGDWGAHVFDAPWEFLRLGLPDSIETIMNEKRTSVVFPMASTIAYNFAARGEGMPACQLVWRDGAGNFPEMPKNVLDKKWKRKDYGAELYTKDGRVFARSSHGAALQLVAGADPKDPQIEKIIKDYPRKKSGHYLNFLNAVRGEEKANSDFEVAGPLSQVMAMGAIAQQLGVPKLVFDKNKMCFIDNTVANGLLAGPPPRKGWEEFEKL